MKYLVAMAQFIIFLCGLCVVYLVPFVTTWLREAEFVAPITWGLCIGACVGVLAGVFRHIVVSGIVVLCPLFGMLFNLMFDNEPKIYIFGMAMLYSAVALQIIIDTWRRESS